MDKQTLNTDNISFEVYYIIKCYRLSNFDIKENVKLIEVAITLELI